MREVMLAFNAFQVVVLFMVLPFIINWLHTGPFTGAGALVWIAVVTYVAMFCFMVGNTAKTFIGD